MNKTILTLAVCIFLASTVPADAGRRNRRHTHPAPAVESTHGIHNTAGIKVDAPRLVKLTKNIFIGIEAGKETHRNIGFDHDYEMLEDDAGWFGFLKVTFLGTWFDFGKK